MEMAHQKGWWMGVAEFQSLGLEQFPLATEPLNLHDVRF